MHKPFAQTLVAPVIGILAALLVLIWLQFPTVVIVNTGLLWVVIASVAYLYIFRHKKHRH